MTGAICHAPGAHTFSRRNLISLIFSSFLLIKASSSPSLLGIHPQDEKYYGSDPINCKDGSKSFTRDRLNDGFCDCVDGTDEPGTSACPEGKFYCRNEGSSPQLLFSSRVNDQLCDCCDGSDEYDGSIRCQNTCIKNGEFSREEISHTQSKSRVNLEDMVQKLKELKIVVFLEVAFLVMAFRLLHRHVRSRRRR